MVIILVSKTRGWGFESFRYCQFYGGYGRVVEDACLWNRYIRNTWVRIPLVTLLSAYGSKVDRLIWDQAHVGSSPTTQTT